MRMRQNADVPPESARDSIVAVIAPSIALIVGLDPIVARRDTRGIVAPAPRVSTIVRGASARKRGSGSIDREVTRRRGIAMSTVLDVDAGCRLKTMRETLR